jgi:hypothetical protein
MTTINVDYAEIDQVLTALSTLFPGEIQSFAGRQIGLGAITKARWLGPGWTMWSDHFRGSDHSVIIKVILQFQQPSSATLFCLRYPQFCHRP